MYVELAVVVHTSPSAEIHGVVSYLSPVKKSYCKSLSC